MVTACSFLESRRLNVVTPSQTGRQETKHQERLRAGLVLDVILDWVGQEELELEENLRKDEAKENVGVRVFADGAQVKGDEKLRNVNGGHGEPLGLFDAERHGKGLQAELAITLDGFEIVDNGDAQTGDGVEHRQKHHVWGQLAKHSHARPPREGDVGRTERVAPFPPLRLELERRRAVNVRNPRAKDGEEEHDGKVVFAPLIQL